MGLPNLRDMRRATGSVNPLTYGSMMRGSSVWDSVFFCPKNLITRLIWFIYHCFGYLFLMTRTSCTYLISVSSSSSLQIFKARCTSVLTTVILWAVGWIESQSKYLSVWVAFLYTAKLKVAVEFLLISTSKKARFDYFPLHEWTGHFCGKN